MNSCVYTKTKSKKINKNNMICHRSNCVKPGTNYNHCGLFCTKCNNELNEIINQKNIAKNNANYVLELSIRQKENNFRKFSDKGHEYRIKQLKYLIDYNFI